MLLAHVLQVSRADLVFVDSVSAQQRGEFHTAVGRRASREPLQHITGEAWFRHLTLAVGPGVFVPRPETEILVDIALRALSEMRAAHRQPRSTVIDLCAGSAAIPLAIATESSAVDAVGVELSAQAMAWARRNAQQYASELSASDSTLRLVEADAAQAVASLPQYVGRAEIVTSNPPYIPIAGIPRDPEVRDFDPAIALFGGTDGLDIVRAVVTQAADFLVDDGWLLIEHGDEQGTDAGILGVPALIVNSGQFDQVQDHLDLTGRPRVTTARRRAR